MSHNFNIINLSLKSAVLVALAIPALTACSAEATNPDAPEVVPATATGTTPQLATTKKLDTAMSTGKILFAASQEADGQHDIYEKDLHTGEVTNLTRSATDELNPQLSPDGSAAVYAGENDKGNYQIFRINLATRKIIQLTNHDANDFDPTFAPDGNILYKSNADDGYGDIWKMNGDGTDQLNLTPNMGNTEEWKPTAISDNLVVFTSRRADDGSLSRQQLADTDELMSLDMSEKDARPKRLTNNDWPDWYSEADPTRPGFIVYTSKATTGGPDTIYEMNVTQPNPEQNSIQLTNPDALPGDSSDCSWASNGTLLFANNGSGRYVAMARTPDNTYYTLHEADGDVLSPIAATSLKID